MMSLVWLVLACAPAIAQQNKSVRPNVLIIGDSVYAVHARGAVNELKGQANVRFANWPSDVLQNSSTAVEYIDLLLGIKDASGKDVPEDRRPTWDLIHLNVGLGDLVYSVP